MKSSGSDESLSRQIKEPKGDFLEAEETRLQLENRAFERERYVISEFGEDLEKRLHAALLEWQVDFVPQEIYDFIDEVINDIGQRYHFNPDILLHNPPLDASYVDKNAVCGHIFEEGDVIYRCKNCAIDETCVQCSKCFLANDYHLQHDYRYSISHENGGCCDCGDTEAWKSLPDCPLHLPEASNANVFQDWPSLFKGLLQSTLRIMLRFVTSQFENVDGISKLRSSLDYVDHLDGEDFVLTLWNDEEHTFDEVAQYLVRNLHKTSEVCRVMACEVDKLGRHPIMHSSSRRRCKRIGTNLQSSGLLVSVHNMTDFHKQEVAALILDALLQLSKNNRAFRKLMILEGSVPYVTGLLAHANTEELYDSRPMRSIIDRLLCCEHRLWKFARLQIRSLIMKGVFFDPETKFSIAKIFASNYETISDAFLSKDREPMLSIHSLTVQLFTTPSIAYYLVRETNFLKVAFQVFDKVVVSACNSGSVPFMRFALNHQYSALLSDVGYLLSCDALHQFLQDQTEAVITLILPILNRLQGLDSEKRQTDIHVEYESQEWAVAFAIVEKVVECCLEKVLVAIQDSPQSSLLVIQMLSRNILSSKQPQILENSFFVAEDPSNNTKFYPSLRFSHDVPVSVHHPYHWVLSFIINHLLKNGTQTEDIVNLIFSREFASTSAPHTTSESIVQNLSFEKFARASLSLVEEILQPFWLRAELKAKMWTRNGNTIHHRFASYFFGTLLSTSFPCLDLHLLQFISCALQPTIFLQHLLSAFHLTEWVEQDMDGFYKIRVVDESADKLKTLTMALQWNLFMIYWFSERSLISEMSHKEDVKRYLIHVLACGPISHSRIRQQMSKSYLFEDSEPQDYMAHLAEVADYQPAKSLTEEGVYVIKDAAFQEHDPYYFRLSQHSREKALNYRKTREAHMKTSPCPYAMLIPRLHKLCPSYHSMYQVILSPSWTDTLYAHLIRVLDSACDMPLREDLLDSTLRLLLLPLYDETLETLEISHTFVENMFDAMVSIRHLEGFPEASLLNLLMNLRRMSDFEIFHVAIDELFKRLRSKLIDASWRQEWLDNFLRDNLSTSFFAPTMASDNLLHRDIATKQKQAKAMRELQERQRLFLAKHLESDRDSVTASGCEENSFIQKSNEDPSTYNDKNWGTCLSCRESLLLDDHRPFGFLGLYQISKLRRYVHHDNLVNQAFTSYDEHLHKWHEMIRHPYEEAASSLKLEKEQTEVNFAIAHIRKLQSEQERMEYRREDKETEYHPLREINGFVSSCGHLAHFTCLKTYLKDTVSRRSLIINKLLEMLVFPCPLCHAPCNTMIPVFDTGTFKNSALIWDCVIDSLDDLNREWGFLESYRSSLETRCESSDAKDSDGSSHIFRPSLVASPRLFYRGRQPLSPSIPVIRQFLQLLGEENIDVMNAGTRDENSMIENIGLFPEEPTNPHSDDNNHIIEELEDSPDNPGISPNSENHISQMSWNFVRSALGAAFSRDPLVFAQILTHTIACREVASREPFGGFIQGELYFQALLEKERKFLRTFMMFAIRMHGDLNDSSTILSEYLNLFLAIASNQSISRVNTVPDRREDSENPSSRTKLRFAHSIHEIDTFDLIVILYVLSPVLRSQPQILVRWGVLAEATKILLSVKESSGDLPFDLTENLQDSILNYITGIFNSSGGISHQKISETIALLRVYLLPFLRRLGCLMYCVFDKPVSEHIMTDEIGEEFEKLLDYLELDRFRDFFREASMRTSPKNAMVIPLSLQNYIRNLGMSYSLDSTLSKGYSLSRLEYPLRLQFVELPEAYQTCLEMMKTLCCMECNLRARRPAMCLLCGAVICTGGHRSQTRDFDDNYGHAKNCNGGNGIFLNFYDTTTVLVHRDVSVAYGSLYTDMFGEMDLNLRRGQPLFLDHKRLEALRKVWIDQLVPSETRRIIEIGLNGLGP